MEQSRIPWSKPWHWEWKDEWGPNPWSREFYFSADEDEAEPKRDQDPPFSRNECAVMEELARLCESCRRAHAEFTALGTKLSRVPADKAGRLYEPLQAMLYRFSRITEELEGLEHAAIEAYKGRVLEEEDVSPREEIVEAMYRCLSPAEIEVFTSRYLYSDRFVNVGALARDWFFLPAGAETQAEIGKRLGVSQSRVSQLEKSAREKMIREVGWLAGEDRKGTKKDQ